MIVVIYDLADGRILQTMQGAQASIEADGRPFVQVQEWRADYDVTHRVENGQLVPVDGAT